MQILSFDELNNLGRERRSIPYNQYFGEMDLTDLQKKSRVLFATDMEEKIMFVFALILAMIENNSIDLEYASNTLYEQYKQVCISYGIYNSNIDTYIRNISRDIVDSTFDNLSDPYFLSADRAVFVAENEANTNYNNVDFENAVKSGKTMKTWIDIRDNRERKSHLKVGRTTIPINQNFIVGDSEMRFPKDTFYGANSKEIVNCRCSVQYS